MQQLSSGRLICSYATQIQDPRQDTTHLFVLLYPSSSLRSLKSCILLATLAIRCSSLMRLHNLVLPFLIPAFATSPASSNKISDTPSSYSYVTKHNEALSPLIRELCSSTDFFKYYKLNLFTRECPYFSEDGAFCGNRACAVDTIDEDEVPEIWRASVLGKLTGPTGTAASNLPLHTAPPEAKRKVIEQNIDKLADNHGETCVQDPVVQDDRNFCIPEDEDSNCVFVSLVDNKERYTGYHGSHAHAIWGSIYRENCFESHATEEFAVVDGYLDPLGISSIDGGYGEAGNAKEQFAQVLRDPLKSGHGTQDTCVEKRIFYRIISGMHTSISAHICAAYLNQLSGKWEPNATCFDERIRAHPERVSNMFFNYVLVSRAVAKLKGYLDHYTYCSGDPAHDIYTSSQVQSITALASDIHYDESPLFEDRLLKEDFRNRFRNISMLMDCVGCDKCRLWGKVQTAGYGTALKILFDDAPKTELRRGEIVALFNTYGRLSASLDSLGTFNYSIPGLQQHGDKPIRVSDDILTMEEVIMPTPENPTTDHAGPTPPLSRIWEILGKFTSRFQPMGNYLPSTHIWHSISAEFAEFGRAFRYIGQSYMNLPRNLWYSMFVSRQDQHGFWDFIFSQKEEYRNREL